MARDDASHTIDRGIFLLERFETAAPWKRGLAVAVVLAILISVLVPGLVFQNKIFMAPDVQAPISFMTVGAEELARGSYPLWNPYLFCGMPSFASLSYTPYVYPPAFLTYVLDAYLGFPQMIWLIFHYFMAAVGTYLLARFLGARASVALLAGIVFMMMPNYVAAGANGHGSKACSIAYLPFAILCSWRILRGRRLVLSTSLLAITLGFQMLRGHLQIAYYTYLAIGLLFIVESIGTLRAREGRRFGASLGLHAAAFAAAVGIAAVLLLPVREYAAYSIRGGGAAGGLDYGYATGWSLHPREMLTFVFPWASGFGKATYWGDMPATDYPNYLGLVTAAFALAALALVKGRAKWYLAITVIATTLVSFGNYFPVLFGPLFRALPFFNKFRVPVMILILQQLAAVLLMAIGLEEYLRRFREESLPAWLAPRRMRWILIGAAALALLALLGGGGVRSGLAASASVTRRVDRAWIDFAASSYTADLSRTLFVAFLIALILVVAARLRLLPGTVVLSLAAVAVIDLASVDRLVVHPERGWQGAAAPLVVSGDAGAALAQPDDLMRFFAGDTTLFRVFPVPAAPLVHWSHNVRPFSENRFMVFKVFSLGGYHAAKLKSYQDVMDAMFGEFKQGRYPKGIVDMLNAKYFYMMAPIREDSLFPLVWQGKDAQGSAAYVYRNLGALPRFFLVDSVAVMDRGAALEAIVAPTFDPAAVAILNEEPPLRPASAAGSSVSVRAYRPNEVTLRAHVEQPCILVASEIAYPEWKVSVDGAEKRMLAANYCLRALALEAGDHEIRIWYSSELMRTALALSIITLSLAIAAPIVHGIAAGRRG